MPNIPTIQWRAVRSNTMTRQTATSQTFLLSKPGRKHSVRCFMPLQPEHVSSRQRIHEVVAQANNHSLWISDDKPLTDTLLHALASRTGSLGAMILLYFTFRTLFLGSMMVFRGVLSSETWRAIENQARACRYAASSRLYIDVDPREPARACA